VLDRIQILLSISTCAATAWPVQMTEMGFPSNLNEIMDASGTNGISSSAVRLTGLRSAAHLNGREGVIRGREVPRAG